MVNEFRTVVRVDPDDRERKPGDRPLERFEHPNRGLVFDGTVDRPTRRDIGRGERETELAAAVSAFMADQINLDEPGPVIVPAGPRPDLYL